MKKPKTTPRKEPTQPRAKHTVDAILAAGEKVLVREGYDRASTNRIADVAGVSIGSLYQYFPSKEALVSALVDRHLAQMLAVLADVGPLIGPDRPVEDSARHVIRSMIESHRVNPRLHKVLMEQVPRVGSLERVDSFEEQTFTLVEAYLAARGKEIRRKNLRLAARVITLAVRANVHWAVTKEPDSLDDDALLDDLTKLAVHYLTS